MAGAEHAALAAALLAAAGPETPDGLPEAAGLGLVLRVITSLAIVVGLVVLSSWVFRRFQPRSREGVLRLHDRLTLGKGVQVVLVSLGERGLVLGVTPQNVSLLEKLPEAELVAQTAGSSSAGRFGAQLARRLRDAGQRVMRSRGAVAGALALAVLLVAGGAPAMAQDAQQAGASAPGVTLQLGNLDTPEGAASALKLVAIFTVLAIAPSILMLTTCFVRLVVVFHFLRQAIGSPQMPPNQVVLGLTLFLTFFIMAPVWGEAWNLGYVPYERGELSSTEALEASLGPPRTFMLKHTREDDLRLFLGMARVERPGTREDVPLRVLVPAFVVSELRTAFELGFLLFLPFLVIDLVVASVLLSMGMMMLPPVMISLPFKVLLFALVDGWSLLAGSLVRSFL